MWAHISAAPPSARELVPSLPARDRRGDRPRDGEESRRSLCVGRRPGPRRARCAARRQATLLERSIATGRAAPVNGPAGASASPTELDAFPPAAVASPASPATPASPVLASPVTPAAAALAPRGHDRGRSRGGGPDRPRGRTRARRRVRLGSKRPRPERQRARRKPRLRLQPLPPRSTSTATSALASRTPRAGSPVTLKGAAADFGTGSGHDGDALRTGNRAGCRARPAAPRKRSSRSCGAAPRSLPTMSSTTSFGRSRQSRRST